MIYIPLTETSPASEYWGINLSSCMYGSHPIIRTPIVGIVDTGVSGVFPLYTDRDTYLFSCLTVILIPDDSFNVYKDQIPGAKFDKEIINLIEIPHSSIEDMKPLHFTFNGHDFTLSANEQLIPQKMNKVWGGDPEKHYGFVGPMGKFYVQGLNFIIGEPFMVKYYTVSSGSSFEKDILNGHLWQVHDAGRKQIGFAEAYVLIWWDFRNLNLSITA